MVSTHWSTRNVHHLSPSFSKPGHCAARSRTSCCGVPRSSTCRCVGQRWRLCCAAAEAVRCRRCSDARGVPGGFRYGFCGTWRSLVICDICDRDHQQSWSFWHDTWKMILFCDLGDWYLLNIPSQELGISWCIDIIDSAIEDKVDIMVHICTYVIGMVSTCINSQQKIFHGISYQRSWMWGDKDSSTPRIRWRPREKLATRLPSSRHLWWGLAKSPVDLSLIGFFLCMFIPSREQWETSLEYPSVHTTDKAGNDGQSW